MIIAGTVIGAGMLANPTATSGVWFAGSLVVLLYTWFSMLSSGLMILEVNTHYPHGASFDTMVKDLLGPTWNIINGVAVAFVLYLLTYAYIFVGGDLTAKGIGSAVGAKFRSPSANSSSSASSPFAFGHQHAWLTASPASSSAAWYSPSSGQPAA